MELKMAFHTATGRYCVEVYDNSGAFVASIYPDELTNGVRIVSKHIVACDIDPNELDSVIPLQEVCVRFER